MDTTLFSLYAHRANLALDIEDRGWLTHDHPRSPHQQMRDLQRYDALQRRIRRLEQGGADDGWSTGWMPNDTDTIS